MTRKIDSLIKQVNTWCESVEEYLQDESSAMAEFCQSFGYGDGEIDLSDLDEYTKPLVDTLFKRVSDRRKRTEILSDCSTLEFISGYYRRDNQIFSAELGECEEQMPDKLEAKLAKLSDAEYELIRKNADCYLPERSRSYWNNGYFSHDSDRWSLVLDVDLLYRALQDIPDTRPIKPIPGGGECSFTADWHARQRRASLSVIVGGAA